MIPWFVARDYLETILSTLFQLQSLHLRPTSTVSRVAGSTINRLFCIIFAALNGTLAGMFCRYKKNRKVSMGTEKWLDAEMWDNSSECIATLRKRGYRIAVTHIAPDTVNFHETGLRL